METIENGFGGRVHDGVPTYLLVLEVCNVKPTYRKSCAANLLMWSDLTLDPSFRVKRGYPNLKVLKLAYYFS